VPTDGIDDVEPDGSFVCRHGMFTIGEAKWTNGKWKVGSDSEFHCPQGHVTLGTKTPPTMCARCGSNDLEPGNISRGTWPVGTKPPRTCSFCGGAHPDDAIDLLKAGFRLQRTDKAFKYYINDAADHSMAPPVKLYGNHVSPEHARRINAALGWVS
jgi:hypothetical protein